jgi:hypothetical protein
MVVRRGVVEMYCIIIYREILMMYVLEPRIDSGYCHPIQLIFIHPTAYFLIRALKRDVT